MCSTMRVSLRLDMSLMLAELFMRRILAECMLAECMLAKFPILDDRLTLNERPPDSSEYAHRWNFDRHEDEGACHRLVVDRLPFVHVCADTYRWWADVAMISSAKIFAGD